MSLRRIARVITPAPPAPGFIGEGHLAVMVVSPDEFPSKIPSSFWRTIGSSCATATLPAASTLTRGSRP